MRTTARRLPFLPFAVAASLLTAFLVLIAPLSASAHDALVETNPAADSTVDALPAELTLTFSAKVDDTPGGTEIVVTDAACNAVTTGDPVLNGAVVSQALEANGAAGVYHVTWRIVSSDGHPTSGEYEFTVASADGTVPSAAASSACATAPASDAAEVSAALPWIIGVIAVVIVAVVVIALLVSRARRGGRSDGSASSSSR